MSRSTTKKHVEQLHLQNSVEETHKENLTSEKLIERERIQKTPFYINGNQEEGYFITLKNYKLTETYPAEEEGISLQEQAQEILNIELWNIIFHTIIILHKEEAIIIQEEQQLQNKQTDGNNS